MSSKYNPVNWFEIPVKDMNRAKSFYEHVFGLELSLNQMGHIQMGWFPMVQDGAGATGTLVKGEGYTPSHSGTLIYFSVTDIDAALKKINDQGGKTLSPRTSIGEYGFYALFEDSEGNRVALHSRE
jgi:predicted enzyme related to lactoylglutathione lyase